MKKLIPFICVLALLLCGCAGGVRSTLASRITPENGEQAEKYFRQELDNAIKEDNHTALACVSNMYEPLNPAIYCEFTLKDDEFIRSLLTTLKKAEFSTVEWQDNSLIGVDSFVGFYLKYEDGTFPLCGVDMEESAIRIGYSDEVAYKFHLCEPELAREIQRMIEQQCAKEGIALVPYSNDGTTNEQ